MDKETAFHAIMLSELPQVGDKAAARILALNRERHHSFATFFRLPEAVLREDYRLSSLLHLLDELRGVGAKLCDRLDIPAGLQLRHEGSSRRMLRYRITYRQTLTYAGVM